MLASQANVRLLIVDDNVDALKMFTALIQATFGCEVLACSDPSESVRAAERLQPHLVLLDLAMPGQDGFAVAQALRALAVPPFKMFAMTGFGDEAMQQRCDGAGFDGFLLKPVDLQRLKRIVESLRSRPM